MTRGRVKYPDLLTLLHMGFNDFRDEESQRKLEEARRSGVFDSKASIFDYLYFTEGLSLEEAEEKALKIAAIRGVPDNIEKPKTGIEGTVDKLEVVFNIAERYPFVKDLLIAGVSAAIGAIGGAVYEKDKQSTQQQLPPQPNLYQQVDIDGNESSENI